MLTSIIFKLLAKSGVSVIEFMFFRNAANLILNFPIMKYYGVNPLKDTNGELNWIIARTVVGQLCFICFQTSVVVNPLSLQLILLQTSPFWTSLLALWLVKERVRASEYVAMTLCFIGIIGIALSKQQAVESAG